MRYDYLKINRNISVENVDDEYIVFVENYSRVLILNYTSSRVLDYFINNNMNKDLLTFIEDYFEIDVKKTEELTAILRDIDACVDEMLQNNVLIFEVE